jgi:hypothetical protein
MHSRRTVLGYGLGLWGAALAGRARADVAPLIAYRAEIEPLVRLIENTAREKCVDMLAAQLRAGVPYRRFLAALYLAGVRNVNPRPPGFALHCLFVTWSAHAMSLDSPESERLLPLVYALDTFKASQDRDARAAGGDYSMRALPAPAVSPARARQELVDAMEAWDQDRSERAVAALVRFHGPAAAIETLWRYGARDFRNIGHKAIFAANAWRTLETIGWEHAEPVMRSLVLGMLDFGLTQRVQGYVFEDQCYLENAKLARAITPKIAWNDGSGESARARDLLERIRTEAVAAACAHTAKALASGSLTPGDVWDAAHLAGAEIRMRCSGGQVILGLHAVTAVSGLRQCYQLAADPETRALLLLQGVGWMGQFQAVGARNEKNFRDFKITSLEAAEPASGDPVQEALAAVPSDLDTAASRVMRFAADPVQAARFASAARSLVYRKASEVHYYKYPASIFEDLPLVSAHWRPQLLAGTVYYMRGPSDPDVPLMVRAREALRGLS